MCAKEFETKEKKRRFTLRIKLNDNNVYIVACVASVSNLVLVCHSFFFALVSTFLTNSLSFFFCSRLNFLDELETLATQAIYIEALSIQQC